MTLGMKGKHQRSRRYPGACGPRPDNKSFRQKEALERQAEYDKLTLEQKLELLERRPGSSAKQREILTKLLSTNKSKIVKVENKVEKFLAKQSIAKKS